MMVPQREKKAGPMKRLVLPALAAALLLLCAPQLPAAAAPGEIADCNPQDRSKEAIDACSRILSLPGLSALDRGKALLVRGFLHYGHNELDLARIDLEEAQQIIASPDISRMLANLYMALGRSDQAIAEFTRLIDAGPPTADLYGGRGAAYQNAGRFDESIADFNQVLALKPDDLSALNNRASAYWKKGDLDTALKEFDAVLAIAPDMAAALANRCMILARQGHFDQGRPSCDKAEKLTPGDSLLLISIGAAYYDAGQFESAIAYCDRGLQSMPNAAPALYIRALAEARLGRNDDSKRDMMEAERLQPDVAAYMAKVGMK